MGFRADLANAFNSKNKVNEQIVDEINSIYTEQWISQFIVWMAKYKIIKEKDPIISFYISLYHLVPESSDVRIRYSLNSEPSHNVNWSNTGDNFYKLSNKKILNFDPLYVAKAILYKFQTFEDFEDVHVNGLGFKDDSAFLEYVFVVTIKNPLIYNEDPTFKD